MGRPKYKIIELRSETKQSKFILMEKVLFWWQKVAVYPHSYINRHTFMSCKTGIEYIDKRRGKLVSLTSKLNKD